MKLLVLIHRLPFPPDRGAKLRAAAELSYLAGRHEVWCAGFIDAQDRDARRQAQQSLAAWRGRCRAVAAIPLRRPLAAARAIRSLVQGATATEGYFASRRLEARVLKWARDIEFDAVFAFSSSMAPLALQVPAQRRVLDLVDVDSRKWLESAQRACWPWRRLLDIEGRRLAQRELDWIAQFDAGVLVNSREAALLDDLDDFTGEHVAHKAMRQKVHVIETGMWAGLDGHARAVSQRLDEGDLTDEPNIGLLGAMDYPPNADAARWFARSILPLVRARRPGAAFWIIGRSPSRAVRKLHDGCSIHVTGTVPAVEPYLARLRVAVAPLRLARGVQTKVLTAMTAGLPCVVTPCVAEGIGARAGVELAVADSADRFARAVRILLDDRERAEALGAAGRRFAARRFNPLAGMDRLEALLRGYDPGPPPAPEPVESDLCLVG